MVRTKDCVLVVWFLLLFAQAVPAANNQDLTIDLSAKKVVVGADGKQVLEPAEVAKPGDVIEYTAVYKNVGKSPIRDLKGVLPVPAGMEYQPGTANPGKLEASLDGRKYAPVPLKRKVRLPNGKEELREVPPSEYRYLRWDLGELAPGRTVTALARMRLGAGAEPVPTQAIHPQTSR